MQKIKLDFKSKMERKGAAQSLRAFNNIFKYLRRLGKTCVALLTLFVWCGVSEANEGIATFYTMESCQKEGTSGVLTASGEQYREYLLTCALRSHKFGGIYRVTNLANGKFVFVRHNDYGPGKKATARGVIIDLSPAAFDALGGKRGKTWGEIKVKVEKL